VAAFVKRSISLPSDVFADLEREARIEGSTVSAVITKALDSWLRRQRGLQAVDQWEAEHGPFTAEELAAADAELDRAFAEAARYASEHPR
jgi:predicted transcriptional regulator